MKLPVVVYRNTVFLRKIEDGYELVPSYDGQIRGQLPDDHVIKRAIKDAPKFKGKKTRFTMIPWDLPGGRVVWEAIPGWGIVAGNLANETNDESIGLMLSQPEIEAVAFIDGEDIEYATKSDWQKRQASQVPDLSDAYSATWNEQPDVPELLSGSDNPESETESLE